MRKLSLVSTAALLLATTTIAFASGEENCLPVSTISSAQFTRATAPDANYNFWTMTTNTFNSQDAMWNITLAVILPEGKTPEEALQLGQQIFQTASLSSPTAITVHSINQLVCFYTNGENGYVVIAANPPIFTDELSQLSLKLK